MEHRPLGRSGLSVSAIAFGTGAMGEHADRRSIDDREAIAAMHQALDAGCNLIDTAPHYGRGRAEEWVGRALIGRRHEVLVSTKCGESRSYAGGEAAPHSLSKNTVLGQCEQSLRRLRVEAIDLYQCCRPDPATPIRETMEALQTLRVQGKIRAVGLCDFGCDELASAREYGIVDAVQTGFSLLNQRNAEDLLPYCREHGVAVLVNSPLARGLLAGTFAESSRPTGMRTFDPAFIGERFRRNLRIAERLQAVAESIGLTLTQLAINWVVNQPNVTATIVGMHRPSQVADVLGGLGEAMNREDRQRIAEIIRGEHDS